ncbi:MAG: hypothetical protein ACQXXH_05470 [Candidatus Bathyarchaeia archaeon]|nr:hypothetical protein [Candidatus Bathyarchaeota archaeon A05DMB-4]
MAQNQNEGQTRQEKGALFEAIVRSLLKKSNFLPIPPDGKQIRNDFYNVRGRACWHNIDTEANLNLKVKCNKTAKQKTVIKQASCSKPARNRQELSKKSAGSGI